MNTPVQQTQTARIWFEDGNSLVTRFNGTKADVLNYYLGKAFNLGPVEDNIVKCMSVHFFVIKLVVINENILGYIDQRSPNQAGILRASVLRGASSSAGGTYPLGQLDQVRLASKKDFESFGVVFDGYEKDGVYQWLDKPE